MDLGPDLPRIERALGAMPDEVWPAAGHGAPSNRRWLARLPGGERAFVKVAAFDYTAGWLRRERANYEALEGLACMPALLGWDDDGACPALAIEDLSQAVWPPPWTGERVAAVREALAEIRATPPPEEIRPATASEMFDLDEGWERIEAEPVGFLGLGVCSDGWLQACLADLRSAADAAIVDGEHLIHGDVRSDNLCLRDGPAVLVDWNWACRGHPDLDLAGWLPSLANEGGPVPWQILPDAGALASLLAGFFLEHARRDPIPQAPHVRRLQLDQGRVALGWAARELGLPPPR